jgi:hypothetical protein
MADKDDGVVLVAIPVMVNIGVPRRRTPKSGRLSDMGRSE